MEVTKMIKARLDWGLITKYELAEQLGITRVTLDRRLKKSDWKKGELEILKKFY